MDYNDAVVDTHHWVVLVCKTVEAYRRMAAALVAVVDDEPEEVVNASLVEFVAACGMAVVAVHKSVVGVHVVEVDSCGAGEVADDHDVVVDVFHVVEDVWDVEGSCEKVVDACENGEVVHDEVADVHEEGVL